MLEIVQRLFLPDTNDPLRSFARTALSGTVSLRDAADDHGPALERAFAATMDAHARLDPADRLKISETARQLQRQQANRMDNTATPTKPEQR